MSWLSFTFVTHLYIFLLLYELSNFSSAHQYSGGQAINGQGGFYGSGGSRSTLDPTTSQKVGLVALATDVQTVQHTMRELETLENLLQREFESSPENSAPTGKLIELKASIKKLMTSSEFTTALNKLEVEGEPVWGLSSEERELISFAREKFNECWIRINAGSKIVWFL